MKMLYPLFAGLGFRCCVSQAFMISILVGVLSCVDDISTWFVVASLSLDSQVLLSVHWLARARVFGLKDYGIYGTKPGRNLRPMGLSRAQNWEAYALPLLLISHMFCPFLSIFEESEAETLTWHRPYSVNFTTSGHAINIPIYIHIIDILMHRCVCVCLCGLCVCVCVNACACHGEKLHDILIYPVYPFKGPWSCPRTIGIGHAPE